jgi:type IV secretory pathway VirB2 component (pilin)
MIPVRHVARRTARGHLTSALGAWRVVNAFRIMAAALSFLTVLAPAAFASSAGAPMPWDTPLQNLLDNLTGPTARALVLIAIVGCGLLWAFTRNEEGLKKLGQIAFGGAIALGAVTLLASLGFAAATL